MKDYLVAVDIGTTKTLALAGRKDASGLLEIIGGCSLPSEEGIKRGNVINIEVTAQAIKAVTDKLKQTAGIDFNSVITCISGQYIKALVNRSSKYIDSPESEIRLKDTTDLAADMHKISLEPGDKILHIIPQSYIVDNEAGIKNPVGIFGKRLEGNFYIVVGPEMSVKNIGKCFSRAGLDVADLEFVPLAAANAVLSQDEKDAGVVLVDFGGGTTSLAIYYDGIIRHTAVIPFGGNAVTNDIKEGCSILPRQAESLKLQYGSAMGDAADENKVVSIPGISGRKPREISFRNLAFIIQARMEELIEMVSKEVESSGIASKLSAGMVISGGGAMLPGLPELISFHTGMDVRIGIPDEKISKNSREEFLKTSHAVGIGLLMYGFEKGLVLPDPVVEEEEENSEPVGKKTGLFGLFGRKIKGIMDEDNIH
ncbi:MAG: cell division protein FtsA [Bacteroidia bacterium]|nr:cell division protein FtsA [Bacteroidia bacterium]